jgi:hypothetical protein
MMTTPRLSRGNGHASRTMSRIAFIQIGRPEVQVDAVPSCGAG